MKLARVIDYTLLKPDAGITELKQFCKRARKYNVYGVCVSPIWVKDAVHLLRNNKIIIGTVIGFPLGNQTSSVKLVELIQAIKSGVREADVVINVCYIKSGWYNKALNELKSIVKLAHQFDVIVKVIIETAYLSKKEIIQAARLVLKSGADFIKTSTGFAPSGVQVEDVKLLKRVVGGKIRIKAAGGIRTKKQALAMIKAGADRLGISKIEEIAR